MRVVVPFAAAGPTDVIARLIGQKLAEQYGHAFTIENVAGAGGNIGTAQVAKSPPDGYTLMVISTGFMVNPSLYAHVPYDPVKDFAPITLIAASPNVLVVNPEVPAKSVKELIALIKANPGKYSYAQPALGSTPHLGGELFKMTFDLDLTMVPFPGAGPAITSTIGGHTPIAFTALPPVIAPAKDGKLRALAVMAEKRVSVLPDVKTIATAGDEDQEADTLTGQSSRRRHAEGDCRPVAAATSLHRRRAGRQGQARHARLPAGCQYAGAVRRADQVRDGEVGQGGPRGQAQDRISETRCNEE